MATYLAYNGVIVTGGPVGLGNGGVVFVNVNVFGALQWKDASGITSEV
jgi:hypothetical protein